MADIFGLVYANFKGLLLKQQGQNSLCEISQILDLSIILCCCSKAVIS